MAIKALVIQRKYFQERLIASPQGELKLRPRRNWMVGRDCQVKDKQEMTMTSRHLGYGVTVGTEEVVWCCGFDHCVIHFYVVLWNWVFWGCSSRLKRQDRAGWGPWNNAVQWYFSVAHFIMAWTMGSWVSKQCRVSLQNIKLHFYFYFLYFITHSSISSVPVELQGVDWAFSSPFGGKSSQDWLHNLCFPVQNENALELPC